MTRPSPPERLIGRFERELRTRRLLRPGDRVLVAFSGGSDSSALLALLLEIRDRWSLDLVLAHLDHRLRKGSAADARFARETADRLGLRALIGAADVGRLARARGLNLEEAGRLARYEFLGRAARKAGASRIATGHTLTDQAETFLMRLLRGSGRTGLAGIHPEVDRLIIRPLLSFERGELESFLKHKGWTWREDESNRDPRFLRGRVRRELLPYLRRRFDPAVTAHLGRTADIVREENAVLEELARRRARTVLVRDGPGPSLDMTRLSRVPAGLRRLIVRGFIQELKGDLRDVSFADVEAVSGLGTNREVVLKPGLVIRREGDRVFRKRRPRPAPGFDFLWDGRGRLPLPASGLALCGRFLAGRPVRGLEFDDSRRVYCDAARLGFPLRVRKRRDGDRYRPLGAPGSKKLKEILRARRVPLAARDRLPVVCSGERIVWVPGLAVAEEFRVRPGTTRILQIELETGNSKLKK